MTSALLIAATTGQVFTFFTVSGILIIFFLCLPFMIAKL